MKSWQYPIRAVREEKGMTQEQTAEALGIPLTQYIDCETGKTEPSIYLIMKLSKIFHVKVENLLPNEPHTAIFLK